MILDFDIKHVLRESRLNIVTDDVQTDRRRSFRKQISTWWLLNFCQSSHIKLLYNMLPILATRRLQIIKIICPPVRTPIRYDSELADRLSLHGELVVVSMTPLKKLNVLPYTYMYSIYDTYFILCTHLFVCKIYLTRNAPTMQYTGRIFFEK